MKFKPIKEPIGFGERSTRRWTTVNEQWGRTHFLSYNPLLSYYPPHDSGEEELRKQKKEPIGSFKF